ncbi:hypothetical protein GCM10010971_26530 [Silvimonas amylolytica]|uniref:TIR domain-containing protein n=2 Tax=Silvimonas amylolytica TaxID=449663 RepID=A0ABQ2PPE0_9NEIS|nr:hypothetical protein GCM10010971_26530 [Silvimonas amylolytica]
MARDELAVALAYHAKMVNDPVLAREAIALSDAAAKYFTAHQGPGGKEAARSRQNNHRLKQMLQPLLGGDAASQACVEDSLALPTFCFISHAYSDRKALNALLQILPRYVQPVVFEAINLPPTDFVSDKLISGVLDAEGVIFIDSKASNKSFWCAFERDLAARKNKRIFRFDPRSNAIEPVQIAPRELMLAHCFHRKDEEDVRRVMRWLVDQRSFAALHDDKWGETSYPPFATMEDNDREMRLFSLRTNGSLYLIFLSEALLDDNGLRTHVVDQMLNHPRSTIVCWLHPRPCDIPGDVVHALSAFPDDHAVAFSHRPTEAEFSVHALDDLSVRLFWVHGQIRSGDWTL